jgi:adenosylmethionine---8-amino-7-oxononanoate aminotransferase
LTAPDGGYLSTIGPALGRFAIERGVLLRPLGNTVYVLPPYCSTDADLALAYDVIADFVGGAR